MYMNFRHPKKYSIMTVGKLWRPQDSSSENMKDITVLELQESGIPQLSGLVDKWRQERKILQQTKEKLRQKKLKKREKFLTRVKEGENLKIQHRKKMEMALQNTVKSDESSDFLLAQLDYFDEQGNKIRNLKRDSLDCDTDYPFQSNILQNPNSLTSGPNSSSIVQMISRKGSESEARFSASLQQNVRRANNEIQYPEYFINKTAIEQAFIRLKKQHELDSEGASRTSVAENEYFKESYNILHQLYDVEMQTLNTKGQCSHNLQFTYRKFPLFPQSLEELKSPSNDPLILFREWCHFHKLSPSPLKKINVQSLLKDYCDSKANDKIRLSSLCTLVNFYSEFQSVINNNETKQHHFSVGQESYSSLKEQYDNLVNTLQNILLQSSGKLKLGTALALSLIGKSSEQRVIIRTTLMEAVSGITTTERKIASLALAYSGVFEHAPFHLILDEWKAAEKWHTLQRYLSGLRWLSFQEPSVIKCVADNLTSDDMYVRLHTCLTLPFLEGNMPASLQYALRQMMCNENIHFLRHAAARVLESKGHGDCVQAHIITTLSSANILRALEVIQLSLMLKKTDRRIAGVLLPCLQSDIRIVKMIALSVIGKLQVTDPMFISAVCQITSDPDNEVREAAFNTLSMMGSELGEVEPLVISSLEKEDDERVRNAVLKLIGAGGIKGRHVEKALEKVLKKTHSKDDQEKLIFMLQNLKVESDDSRSEKSSLADSSIHSVKSVSFDASSKQNESSSDIPWPEGSKMLNTKLAYGRNALNITSEEQNDKKESTKYKKDKMGTHLTRSRSKSAKDVHKRKPEPIPKKKINL